jgi:predicted RND superfamily exporter protein
MLGSMTSFGMSLNFYNMVVLPTVLGMGADAGVHIVHRWKAEGRNSVRRVLTTTGEAVTMCTVTTMLGFSGMTASFHPGLRSMGWLAIIGLGSVLAAALVLLPALLQLLDDRKH